MSYYFEPLGNTMTFDGLYCWYKHLFEKLGWMVLSKKEYPNDNHTINKINCYIESIEKLHDALRVENHNFRTDSEKHDIRVMRNKLEILLKHAKKDLIGNINNSSKKIIKN